MVPPVPLGAEIPPEPPDVGARALYIAGRLLAGATTFFFLAFVFAYFYLRSLNQRPCGARRTRPRTGLWRGDRHRAGGQRGARDRSPGG